MSKQMHGKSEALKLLNNFGIKTPEQLTEVMGQLGIMGESLEQADLIKIRDHLIGLTAVAEEPQPTPPKALEAGEITKADEAVSASAHSLIEAQKVTTQEVIATQDAQDELLGEVSGIKGGLKFMSAHIRSKQTVLNAFMDETLQGINSELDQIDAEVIALANESGKWLLKSVQRRQKTSEMLTQLRQRVNSMSRRIQ